MKNTNLGLLLLDALCAGALSLGAALVALPAVGLQAEILPLGGAVCIVLALFGLTERRPWLLPAGLAGCGVVVLAIAALFGQGEALLEAAAGYAGWAVEETVNGEPQFSVYLVCAAPIVLAFWGILRWGRTRRAGPLWAVTLLCGGLIGYQALFVPENWMAPFLLLCAGMILFLPRASLGREGRLQAQILAAALVIPVLVLGLALGPKENGQWRSKGVGHLVQDVQDFWVFHWGELPALPVTSMRSMGLQPQKDRLGGDRETSDSVVITSDTNLLLKGQVLVTYTGSGWEDAPAQDTGNFRYESPFWQGRRREAFGLTGPPDVSKPLIDDLLVKVDADLRVVRRFRSLFLPYRVERLELTRPGGELYFNMQGEAYWNRQPEGGVEYQVEAEVWNFRDKNFDRNLLLYERALAAAGEDRLYTQAAEENLQLPETLPEWVKELAGELTEDCRSPYGKAVALRDYLRENCQYTLTPGPVDPEEDFVAEFLTRRKGYCTYYASALTVLCRCAGVPARYVTGYGMVKEGERFAATQATAHAWTEVYLENLGWVPLDALTQEIFSLQNPPPEEAIAGDGVQGPPVTPSPTPAPAGEELWTVEPEERGFDPLVLLWLVPVAVILAGMLGGKLLRSRRYRIGYVKRKPAGQAAEHVYVGMLRLLRLLRVRPQEGETLLGFWRRAGELLPEAAGLEQVGEIMDRMRFGGMEPGEGEIVWLCEMYAGLEECARKKLGVRGWLLV